MTELLAPAGNMEALKAAISNGCDAIYLGMQKFGARAYSNNFDEESLREAVEYAHLRNVKIYVTMNTIVFENEIEDMHSQLRAINEIGVDGVIVQDLAVFEYIVNNFVDMEAHCSTQMGIDDLEGTLLFKELGAKRVVLAREVQIDKVKEIKRISGVPIEIFVHGALCVSYSGNCLMSGLIGYRSGNRGRCVGSCRKPYELIDRTTGTPLGESYLISTKDLNTIDRIEDLCEIDSLKIEGRMKEPAYVANVVAKYRAALDGKATSEDKDNLKKTFNRTFTKGYLFGEDPREISNIVRPNNFGYEIGYISRSVKGMYEIRLSDTLCQNDIIRISHGAEDVNLSVVRLYDIDGNLINKASNVCYIKIKEKLSKGDLVYKTKDYAYYKELENNLEKEFRRFPLNLRVYAYPYSNLIVDAEGLGCHYLYEGDEVLSEAINNPTTKEQVVKQFARLNDTVFTLGNVDFEECHAFIPAKMMNAARREIVQALYEKKLACHPRRVKGTDAIPEASGSAKIPEDLDSSVDLVGSAKSPEAAETVKTAGAAGVADVAGVAASCSTDRISADFSSGLVSGLTPASNSGLEIKTSGVDSEKICHPVRSPYLTAYVTTREQYNTCKASGIDTIYYSGDADYSVSDAGNADACGVGDAGNADACGAADNSECTDAGNADACGVSDAGSANVCSAADNSECTDAGNADACGAADNSECTDAGNADACGAADNSECTDASNAGTSEKCFDAGMNFDVPVSNVVRRNQIKYYDRGDAELLIGGYGGIYYYKDRNSFVTDYSLNVVNATSCRKLHELGAKRVTLSYELNKRQIEDLISAYYKENGGYPSLEMIVYGKAPLLFTKYCPLKKMGQCGLCRTNHFELKDDYGTFPILSNKDCSTVILNGKTLNLLDEIPDIHGVEAFRLNFTTESPEQIKSIIKAAQKKLTGNMKHSVFNQNTDTRGHYNKEIM